LRIKEEAACTMGQRTKREGCVMESVRREQNICVITRCDLNCLINPAVYQIGLAENPNFRITPGEGNGKRQRIVDCEMVDEFPPSVQNSLISSPFAF
jgi:hypothetical protein